MINSPSVNYDAVYADLELKFQQAALTADIHLLDPLWSYLQLSEQKLIVLMGGGQPSDNTPGSIEFGPTLYMLNNDLSVSFTKTLRDLGMPQSSISQPTWNTWMTSLDQGAGVIAGDGTLFSTIPFGQLDTGWTLAPALYIWYNYLFGKKAPFGDSPATINIGNQSTLTIAVMGDWGTGPWADGSNSSPSVLVGNAIKSLTPDITLHLGDVYYAGLAGEETDRLFASFPAGSQYSFTLNSNHEMYDGATGYFGTALTNAPFLTQKNTSYFVINYADWVLIALDSAYYDTSFFVMQGGLDAVQQSFVQNLNIPATKKVIMFTHHTALTTDGTAVNNASDPNNLLLAVYTALNKRYPDFWYYGHTHNGIVYNDNSATKNYTTAFNLHPQIRCMGHGAIPFGNGYDLYGNGGTPIDTVDYYAHTPMPSPNTRQTKRVLNGFALLTLSNGSITEDVYEVYPDGTKKVAWTNTSNF
ncbi:MAG: metallophosphoesterase [Chitinophagaceae bacterium]